MESQPSCIKRLGKGKNEKTRGEPRKKRGEKDQRLTEEDGIYGGQNS